MGAFVRPPGFGGRRATKRTRTIRSLTARASGSLRNARLAVAMAKAETHFVSRGLITKRLSRRLVAAQVFTEAGSPGDLSRRSPTGEEGRRKPGQFRFCSPPLRRRVRVPVRQKTRFQFCEQPVAWPTRKGTDMSDLANERNEPGQFGLSGREPCSCLTSDALMSRYIVRA